MRTRIPKAARSAVPSRHDVVFSFLAVPIILGAEGVHRGGYLSQCHVNVAATGCMELSSISTKILEQVLPVCCLDMHGVPMERGLCTVHAGLCDARGHNSWQIEAGAVSVSSASVPRAVNVLDATRGLKTAF